ncbi:MAG: type II toxin-antitoxin system PemK/MazF family toxin [Caulobacteraceae bacterium]
MVVNYSNRSELIDDRQFAFGEIWKLRDELIRLLPSDRIKNERTIYKCRTVVIVQNSKENNDENYLLIRIAPLTTTVEFEQIFDVVLLPNKDEVKDKCMAQIQLTQPILKKDLFEKVGEISIDKKNEIAATIMKMVGIDISALE